MQKYTDLQSWFDATIPFFATMERMCGDVIEFKTAHGVPARTVQCYMYKEDTDERCIIGQHIPDGHAAQKACGAAWNLTAWVDLIGVAFADCENGMGLAMEMQGVHDTPENWDETGFIGWGDVERVAQEFGLTFTMPNLDVASIPTEAVV